MNIGKIADALGIIGFIGAIVAGLWGVVIASQLMLSLGVVYIIAYLAVKSWLLSRENKKLHSSIKGNTSFVVEKYFKESIWIGASRKNKQSIPAHFLRWNKCTILVWVYVHAEEVSLQGLAKDRYLISHSSNRSKGKNDFSFLFSQKNKWSLNFSNNSTDQVIKSVSIDNGLTAGWHHFIIQWDRLRPELKVLIDEGESGVARTENFLANWPDKINDNVIVGSWVDGNKNTYCNTKLLGLWICSEYLSVNHEVVRSHLETLTTHFMD